MRQCVLKNEKMEHGEDFRVKNEDLRLKNEAKGTVKIVHFDHVNISFGMFLPHSSTTLSLRENPVPICVELRMTNEKKLRARVPERKEVSFACA
jgi:hypothetical protein